MAEVSLEEAKEIHGRLLVFDGHNDTPVERVHRGETSLNWMRRDEAYHMDLPRMREGGFDGGFFVVGNGPSADVFITLERTLAQLDAHQDDLELVLTAADVHSAKRSGRIAVTMAIEGAGRWLNESLDMVSFYHRQGVRSLGITHGEGGGTAGMLQGRTSPFGSCTLAERDVARCEGPGLTDFGREVLSLSNEIGLVTDLAHISDRSFYEVLNLSAKPVTMTHTGVCRLCGHWRCMTDDQIRALAAAGGVMGIAFAPFFIHPEAATIDHLAQHVCYVAELVGIDYVAIGSDFDGLGSTIPVVPDVAQLPLLTHSLLKHGLSEEEVGKVWGGNFLRLLVDTIG